MNETEGNTQGQKPKASTLFKGRRFAIIAAVAVAVCLVLWILYCRCGPPNTRNRCAAILENLGKALVIYSCDCDCEQYPEPNKWCDLLMEHTYVPEMAFRCPANKQDRCSYALNPNVTLRSNPRLVLLFETKGGWNQFGGPELLSTENHGSDGCHVCFNDQHVEWVTSDQFDELKWTSEQKQ